MPVGALRSSIRWPTSPAHRPTIIRPLLSNGSIPISATIAAVAPTAFIGKVFPSQFDPANAIETASDNSNSGSGTIQRQEKISLTIAATVSQVLPNGNMVIQGTQEVKTNNELRQLTVSGIVRPEDITAANTIRHTQIAEARISYGGRGDQSRVQRTPAGQALVERFSPF